MLLLVNCHYGVRSTSVSKETGPSNTQTFICLWRSLPGQADCVPTKRRRRSRRNSSSSSSYSKSPYSDSRQPAGPGFYYQLAIVWFSLNRQHTSIHTGRRLPTHTSILYLHTIHFLAPFDSSGQAQGHERDVCIPVAIGSRQTDPGVVDWILDPRGHGHDHRPPWPIQQPKRPSSWPRPKFP